jgi:polyketide biosynthesis enoyl-CoA hydratase PksI
LAAIEMLAQDRECRVAMLTGLPEYFSTGATREALQDIASGKLAPTELILGRRLMSLPMPVIAAAEGHAIGGGLALMMSCDLAVIAEESRYGANFMTMGFTPGMGTTRLLEYAFGPAMAHELLYTADLWRGTRFVNSRGINGVLPRQDVRQHVLLLARAIAEKPSANLQRLKRVLSLPKRQAYEEAITQESLMHEISFASLDINQWGVP